MLALDSMSLVVISGVLAVISDIVDCSDTTVSDIDELSVTLDPITSKYKEASNLLNGMLDLRSSGYDKRLRPGFQRRSPTKIQVDLNIRSMGPISEVDMTYSMDTYFRQTWTDERLRYAGENNTELVVSNTVLKDIWIPDTYFYNGLGSYLHTTTVANKLLRIRPNGEILYSMRITIKASCPMYLHFFPIDVQICPLQIGSYAYTREQVAYEWKNGTNNSIEIDKDMRLSQFDLVSTPADAVVMRNSSGEYSTLRVNFVLQRHMGYFLIQVYVPCTLIVVLSWVSFWINREATEDRVNLGVLAELTLTTVSMDSRDDLPKVPYPTALDWFIIMCYFFVTATIIEYAGVHYFTKIGTGDYVHPDSSSESEDDEPPVCPYHHFQPIHPDGRRRPTKRKRRLPPKENSLFKFLMCLQGSAEYKATITRRATGVNTVSRIDQVSRILFPLSFIFLNVVYWIAMNKSGFTYKL